MPARACAFYVPLPGSRCDFGTDAKVRGGGTAWLRRAAAAVRQAADAPPLIPTLTPIAPPNLNSDSNPNPNPRHAKPQTPLLSRRFWRLVIDEAQAVQARSATPTMLAAMAARIEAQHRWCVTGTPLSLERGVADAYDLLRFLQCSHPLARDRARFLRAAAAVAKPPAEPPAEPPASDAAGAAAALAVAEASGGTGNAEAASEAAALLRLLSRCMWRTAKTHVAAELGMAPPVAALVGVRLNAAEAAWAQRDAAVVGLEGGVPPPPPEEAEAAGCGAGEPEEGGEGGEGTDGAERDGDAAGSVARGEGSGALFELQRALTHPQLSRAWVGLGPSEAQLERGASTHALEQAPARPRPRPRPRPCPSPSPSPSPEPQAPSPEPEPRARALTLTRSRIVGQTLWPGPLRVCAQGAGWVHGGSRVRCGPCNSIILSGLIWPHLAHSLEQVQRAAELTARRKQVGQP